MTIRSHSLLTIAAGIALLAAPLAAAEPMAETKVAATRPATRSASQISDVSLDTSGNLRGTFITSNGGPLAREKVTISQGRRAISTVTTNAQGQFAVSNLRPGIYQLTSGKDSSVVRVWSSDSAPPKSRNLALLVQGKNVARAQMELAGLNGGMMGLGGLAIGGAGLGFGISGTIDAGDSNDRADALQRRVDQLSNSP